MLYLGIFILFLILGVCSRKLDVSKAAPKGAIDACFYRIAVFLLYQWRQIRGSRQRAMRIMGAESLKICLLVFFVGNAAALILWLSGEEERGLIDGGYLLREEQGGKEREVTLSAKNESGEEAQVYVTVRAMGYTREEQAALCERMLKELETSALGENTSWNEISGPLVLPKSVAGYPFTLKWRSLEPAVLSSGGKVADRNDSVWETAQAILVKLRLEISGENFEREHSFYARVVPPREEADFTQALQEALEEAEKNTGEEKVQLPVKVQGEKVSWSAGKQNRSAVIFWLGVAAAGAAVFFHGREMAKEEKERGKQMEKEYPAIVSKITLYLGAGMNIRSAWEKIAEGAQGKNNNPVYEEMRITCREMEGGVAEAEAYARFGRRVRQQCYVRFATLLTQNVKKGNAALLSLLRQEAFAALNEHTSFVKRAGEESATKLLLPMIMLMGMVMVLIMVPAFMGM